MLSSPLRLLSCGLLFASALPLCAQDPVRYHGVELKLPKGWTTQQTEEVTLLLPAGWKKDEQTGEAYGLLFDDEIKELGSEDLGETIDSAAAEIFAPGKRKGAPVDGTFGALPGKTFRYGGKNEAGQDVELRIHVFVAKDGCAALFMLGFPAKLTARSEELKAMLGSLQQEGAGKPKRRAFGSKQGEPGPGEEPAPRTEEPKGQNPLGRRPQGETEPPAEEPRAGGQNPIGRRPAEEGQAVRIPGGTETDWNGIKFDLPRGWRSNAGEQGVLALLPPGFGESGVVDELYVLCGDGSLKSLDDAAADQRIKQALDEVQPGLVAEGAAKAARFGAIQGRQYVYTGQAPNGEKVRAMVYAFPTPGGVRGLLALGYPNKLEARSQELKAVLGSLRGGAPAAAGAVPQELAGRWVYFTNVTLNNGGRASQTVLTLRADGTYVYSAETSSTNPLGGSSSQQRDEGRWQQQGDSLMFRSNSGGEASYRLEKRNHPKNKDPMIVLDGKAFVTETQRAPW